MVRLVHLSDIHFSKLHIKDFELFIVNTLIKDLKRYMDTNPIDYVIITGDLIDKGGLEFASTEEAFYQFQQVFIDPISSALSIEKENFFFIPGNHDIDRNLDEKYVDVGLKKDLSSTEKVNEFIDNKKIIGVERLSPYKKYERDYYASSKHKKYISDYEAVFLVEKGTTKIGISCFNTAWRCYSDDDKYNILLGERQITNARELNKEANLLIALMHHPIEWLSEFERKNTFSFLSRDYDILLCGHTHESSTFQISSLNGKLLIIHSPANWTSNIRSVDLEFSNGYQIIDYDIIEKKVKISYRRYSHKKESYVTNTDISEEGEQIYLLPKGEELERQYHETDLAKNIEQTHITELNEHLINYYTNSNSPKDLSKIFVKPRLSYREKDKDDEEKECFFEMDDILSSNNNFLIFGTKESGKTILLDKLLIKYVQEINLHHKIPVYLDFNELGNKRFETIISQFITEPITQLDEYLKANKVVLLVDNFNFIPNNEVNIRRLEKFIFENKIQIICTSIQFVEGEPPLDYIKYHPSINFFVLHFKSFNTAQIKKLIDNWFYGIEKFETPEKCDKILNVLLSLNLPRSPLTISMFLWIIEQQESYQPQNHALMLENFVEKILEKTSKKPILSEKFDFVNKVKLLSEIAFKMYQTDNYNYNLTFHELNEFIHERMVKKKFEFDSVDILNDFLDKGIFLVEHNGTEKVVRFRFNCFFEYFLMKKIETDNDFRNAILKNQNYLNFYNEIDYFTGIKRDQINILKITIEDMKKTFEELIGIITNAPDSFDSIFDQSNNSLASTLDANFIKKINNNKLETQKEIEVARDQMVDSMPSEKELVKKSPKLNITQKLERSWTLAAKVLKNSEEIDDGDLKKDAFNSILECSMAYAFLYQFYLEELLEQKKDTPNISQYEKILSEILPLVHQVILNKLLGTAKLSVVIREHLDEILSDSTKTDFEKFIVVFLYSDLLGKDYVKYLNKFVKSIKKHYIYDVSLFKLISYYHMRSKSKESNVIYENLMSDIIISAKGMAKIKKGEIINSYRKQKMLKKDKDDDPTLF